MVCCGLNGEKLLLNVSAGAWLGLDLLRQRRERYGTQRPKAIAVRTLLLRGGLIGSVLPAIFLLSCLWLWLSESRLRQRAVELQPWADEHDQLEVKIVTEAKNLDKATEINQAMARAMVNVRSSSVLLAELRRIVPRRISFDQARINGDSLELSGEVLMPDGLRTLNALMLSLAQSVLFDHDGVTLKQASLQRSASTGVAYQGGLSYGLSARFASDAPTAIRPKLAALGAIGLEQRLLRLDHEKGLFE